jgi:hypothetical protein
VSQATIIDGKALAALLRRQIGDAAARLKGESGIVPGLATILVGDDPASLSYVRSKGRAATETGIASFECRLPADTAEAALVTEVQRLAADERVDAILVQLPLPPQIDAHRVIATIGPEKDVDGFHPLNVGRLWSGLPGLVPCTPQACLRLIRTVTQDLHGHSGPYPEPRPGSDLPACRHPRCRGRPPPPRHPGMDQARRHRHRCRHQPGGCAGRQEPPRRRCRLCRGARRRRGDHAGARRGRTDDDRLRIV